jgi:hypothetical protein
MSSPKRRSIGQDKFQHASRDHERSTDLFRINHRVFHVVKCNLRPNGLRSVLLNRTVQSFLVDEMMHDQPMGHTPKDRHVADGSADLDQPSLPRGGWFKSRA